MGRLFISFAALIVGSFGCSETVVPVDSGDGGGGAGGTTASGGVSAGTPVMPTATSACPDFVNGAVNFAPAGITARDVQVFIGDNPTAQDGPLIFYWHGTGSSPVNEPPYGLEEAMDWALAEGGVVVAPFKDAASGTFPWFLTTGGDNETDLILADEVLACAIEKVGINPNRIHSIGMSAGGLQTTQMSYRRADYLASVVSYSGGKLGEIPYQNETNRFPAMIFHGGANDTVVVNFKDLSEAWQADLTSRGAFSFICDHGGGHTIPRAEGEQAAVKAFFEAHPWGTTPSPYLNGLPGDFPSYCSLQQ